MKMTFQEIRIIATGPCITNQLRDVNTICRRSWYIAAHIWKIYDFKIEVVPFIINFRTAILCFYQDMLKETTGVNRSRKQKNFNTMTKRKTTNNDLHNMAQKTKDRQARTSLKIRGDVMCSGSLDVPAPLVAPVMLLLLQSR